MEKNEGNSKARNRRKIFAATAVLIFAAIASSCSTEGAGNADAAPAAPVETRADGENKAPPAAEKPSPLEASNPPKAYKENCARCHGAKGEGAKKNPTLIGAATRAEDAFTEAELMEIINDAKSFGLSAKMPSFKNKLTEIEKREIIGWLKTLK